MKSRSMLARTAVRLFVVTAILFLWHANRAEAQESYTVTIYNNSTRFTIYPVISTPTNGPDQWLQAEFQVPDPTTSDRKYGHSFVYRLYVNYPKGILPGSHATVTLPFWSQLVSPADGSQPDQYIDWWNGGRVYVYESLRVTSKPPPALVKDYTADQAGLVDPIAGTPLPTCLDCQNPTLQIFKGPVALPDNEPAQLTEYTLTGIDPLTNPYKLLKRPEVDYDISYVDHAYLPVAMGPSFPSGKSDLGYIGTAQAVSEFKSVLEQFLKQNPGWPRYLDAERQNGGKPFLRIPGAYNAVLAIPPDPGSLIEKPGIALSEMKDLWSACTGGASITDICGKIRDLNGFFLANYDNYYAMVQAGQCSPPYSVPAKPTLDNLLGKVYGWVQWNEYCIGGAGANDLSQTPGYVGQKYGEIHSQYIKLQYTSLTAGPLDTFNPYVKLIHGANYLNMPGSYAFSIDDDVGNMQVANATGIILAVGGTNGLQNQDPYDPATAINVSLGDPNALKRPVWTNYGICSSIADKQFNPDQLGFQVAVPPTKFPCKIVLKDAQERSYQFTIQSPPPYPASPSAAPIADCTGPTSSTVPGENWCATVKAKTNPPKNYIPKSYVETGPTVPFP